TNDGKPARAGGPTSTQRKAGGRARVPTVAGLTTADAEAKLREKHLIPQVRVVSNPAAKGIALYTEPGAGSVAKEGATIGLFVSAGPAPPPKHPPDHHPKDEKKKKHEKGGGHD
ncbi:MAG TPA: PASTA domain-containing protein, partial [Actinomycetota bacterium]|nr:PASTA domain-containing protein [Actinomycetota bacterium]